MQVAVNNDVNDVWMFWDTHKMFSQWAGVLRQLYMSAAALVAGWVSEAHLQQALYSVLPSVVWHCHTDAMMP